MRLLLRYEADCLKTDGEGKTALDQARQAKGAGKEAKHQEVARVQGSGSRIDPEP